MAAQTGFWCAYFTNSKHPKPLNKILKDIYNPKKHKSKHVNTVDVEKYLAMEKAFEENYRKWQTKK